MADMTNNDNLVQLERAVAADPTDTAAATRLQIAKCRAAGKPVMVRSRTSYFGACQEIGVFVRETASFVVYSCEEKYLGTDNKGDTIVLSRTVEKRIKRATPAKGLDKTPHLVPCVRCADHAESVFGPGRCSIHGNAIPCTTCMET